MSGFAVVGASGACGVRLCGECPEDAADGGEVATEEERGDVRGAAGGDVGGDVVLYGATRTRRHISDRGGIVKCTMVLDAGCLSPAPSSAFDRAVCCEEGEGGWIQGFPETVSSVRCMSSVSAGNQRSLFCARLSSLSAVSWAI